MKLVNRTEINKPKEVFNLHIRDDHNYIVEGAVVSNCHMVKDLGVLHRLLGTTFSNVPIRWGLTGTVPEDEYNQMSLYSVIGPLVGQLEAKDLQDAGHLAQ